MSTKYTKPDITPGSPNALYRANIPEDFEFVHLIKFLPDPPSQPHSDDDHAEADMWNDRLQELMKKERAYASNL